MSKPPKIIEYDYLLPPEECERAYRILGGQPTDDPCGHPDQFLKADRVCFGDTAENDGMRLAWGPRVLLNPTHGERRPEEEPNFEWYPLSRWVQKASIEAQRGSTVLALLPAATDRAWFHTYLPEFAASVCLLRARIKSYAPDREGGGSPILQPQPRHPHLYALFTKDQATFDRFYEELGKDTTERERMGVVFEPNPPNLGV